MDPISLPNLIRRKLVDRRLPQNSIPRVWGGPSNGEGCGACAETIGPNQFVMEGVSTDLEKRALQFHVECFHLWDAERTVPGRRQALAMDILAAFLQMFAPRKICGACLARVTDEPVLPTEQRLEGMVRDRTLAADRARCLNCEGLARVYWHGQAQYLDQRNPA